MLTRVGNVFGVGDAQFFVEKLSDLGAAQVHGRGDDVRGFFVAQLDDVFAQIGFDDALTGGFERPVKLDFFADHGFGFGKEQSRRRFSQIFGGFSNLKHHLHGFGGVAGAVDGDAVLPGAADELLQICVKVLNHVSTDGVGPLAALAPVRQGGKCVDAALNAPFRVTIQGFLQIFVSNRLTDFLVEDIHG